MMKRFLTLSFLFTAFISFGQANINMTPSDAINPFTRYVGCEVSTFNDDGGNLNYSDNFQFLCNVTNSSSSNV